jgi:hypothetical protein
MEHELDENAWDNFDFIGKELGFDIGRQDMHDNFAATGTGSPLVHAPAPPAPPTLLATSQDNGPVVSFTDDNTAVFPDPIGKFTTLLSSPLGEDNGGFGQNADAQRHVSASAALANQARHIKTHNGQTLFGFNVPADNPTDNDDLGALDPTIPLLEDCEDVVLQPPSAVGLQSQSNEAPIPTQLAPPRLPQTSLAQQTGGSPAPRSTRVLTPLISGIHKNISSRKNSCAQHILQTPTRSSADVAPQLSSEPSSRTPTRKSSPMPKAPGSGRGRKQSAAMGRVKKDAKQEPPGRSGLSALLPPQSEVEQAIFQQRMMVYMAKNGIRHESRVPPAIKQHFIGNIKQATNHAYTHPLPGFANQLAAHQAASIPTSHNAQFGISDFNPPYAQPQVPQYYAQAAPSHPQISQQEFQARISPVVRAMMPPVQAETVQGNDAHETTEVNHENAGVSQEQLQEAHAAALAAYIPGAPKRAQNNGATTMSPTDKLRHKIALLNHQYQNRNPMTYQMESFNLQRAILNDLIQITDKYTGLDNIITVYSTTDDREVQNLVHTISQRLHQVVPTLRNAINQKLAGMNDKQCRWFTACQVTQIFYRTFESLKANLRERDRIRQNKVLDAILNLSRRQMWIALAPLDDGEFTDNAVNN